MNFFKASKENQENNNRPRLQMAPNWDWAQIYKFKLHFFIKKFFKKRKAIIVIDNRTFQFEQLNSDYELTGHHKDSILMINLANYDPLGKTHVRR